MRKTSVIITLLGIIFLTTVATTKISAHSFWLDQYLSLDLLLIMVPIISLYIVLQIIIPLLSLSFTLSKNRKLVLVGYILAMVSGVLGLILGMFSIFAQFIYISLAAALPIIVGAILGVIDTKKNQLKY